MSSLMVFTTQLHVVISADNTATGLFCSCCVYRWRLDSGTSQNGLQLNQDKSKSINVDTANHLCICLSQTQSRPNISIRHRCGSSGSWRYDRVGHCPRSTHEVSQTCLHSCSVTQRCASGPYSEGVTGVEPPEKSTQKFLGLPFLRNDHDNWYLYMLF